MFKSLWKVHFSSRIVVVVGNRNYSIFESSRIISRPHSSAVSVSPFPPCVSKKATSLTIMSHAISRTRLSSGSHVKTIGTHNGTFHCDEVLAIAMLKALPEYADAQVIR
jgi:hypothetical protein